MSLMLFLLYISSSFIDINLPLINLANNSKTLSINSPKNQERDQKQRDKAYIIEEYLNPVNQDFYEEIPNQSTSYYDTNINAKEDNSESSYYLNPVNTWNIEQKPEFLPAQKVTYEDFSSLNIREPTTSIDKKNKKSDKEPKSKGKKLNKKQLSYKIMPDKNIKDTIEENIYETVSQSELSQSNIGGLPYEQYEKLSASTKLKFKENDTDDIYEDVDKPKLPVRRNLIFSNPTPITRKNDNELLKSNNKNNEQPKGIKSNKLDTENIYLQLHDDDSHGKSKRSLIEKNKKDDEIITIPILPSRDKHKSTKKELIDTKNVEKNELLNTSNGKNQKSEEIENIYLELTGDDDKDNVKNDKFYVEKNKIGDEVIKTPGHLSEKKEKKTKKEIQKTTNEKKIYDNENISNKKEDLVTQISKNQTVKSQKSIQKESEISKEVKKDKNKVRKVKKSKLPKFLKFKCISKNSIEEEMNMEEKLRKIKKKHSLLITDNDKILIKNLEELPGYSNTIENLVLLLKDFNNRKKNSKISNKTETDNFLKVINDYILSNNQKEGLWHWNIKDKYSKPRYSEYGFSEYILALEKVKPEKFVNKIYPYAIKYFK